MALYLAIVGAGILVVGVILGLAVLCGWRSKP